MSPSYRFLSIDYPELIDVFVKRLVEYFFKSSAMKKLTYSPLLLRSLMPFTRVYVGFIGKSDLLSQSPRIRPLPSTNLPSALYYWLRRLGQGDCNTAVEWPSPSTIPQQHKHISKVKGSSYY